MKNTLYLFLFINLLLYILLVVNAYGQIGYKEDVISIENISEKILYLNYTDEVDDFISITISPKETKKIYSKLPFVLYRSSINKEPLLVYRQCSFKLSTDIENNLIVTGTSIEKQNELNSLKMTTYSSHFNVNQKATANNLKATPLTDIMARDFNSNAPRPSEKKTSVLLNKLSQTIE